MLDKIILTSVLTAIICISGGAIGGSMDRSGIDIPEWWSLTTMYGFLISLVTFIVCIYINIWIN
jgi:hypothetical protein